MHLRILGCAVASTLLYGCESWKLTEKVARKLNSTYSKMQSKISGREVADEARMATVNVYHAPDT